ncbi:MAG: hypothetical protein UH734_04100 [Ruminococcus sp.]|nr:hypothetical protein [Ruminococcus sp.]
MKKSNKKPLILAIVALILVLVSFVSFTYSWIDDIKLVEFQNDSLAQNGAPLKTGTDINAAVNITKGNNTVDLGNMLQTSDISFQYKNGNAQPYNDADATATPPATQHIKYDTESSNGTKNPDMDTINKKKGYFYESGGMHLSGCYSDGETFYFPRQGESGYREGNKDDENVNYISFTAKVSSPDANVDFWFKQLPSITDQSGNSLNNYARYAIIVDGNNHVYSSTGNYKTCNAQLNGLTTVTTRSTAAYTFGDNANNPQGIGQNGNVLFSVKKGATVNLTIKIWLEGEFSATASNIDLQLASSWCYSRDITIVDQTSSCKYIATDSSESSSWLGDNPVYFTLPDVLTEMCKKRYGATASIRDWDRLKNQPGYEDAPFYNIKSGDGTKIIVGTTDGFTSYTIKNVPLVYNNEKMILYRCNNAWNTGNRNDGVNDGADGDYEVCYYNWWTTYMPGTYTTATYRLYGGSHDDYAYRYFKDNVDNKAKTYQGYGTWGNLIKIQVDGRTKAKRWSRNKNNTHEGGVSTNLAYKANTENGDSRDLYVCDYSDKKTSGEVYIHGMSYAQSDECWFAYVPESSTLLQFYYDDNTDNDSKGWWAYNSWSGRNPQQRPLNSYKYYFTHRIDHGKPDDGYYDAGKDGIGYWDGVDKVYLLKNGNIGTANIVAAYMYHNDGDSDYDTRGYTNMTNTNQVDPRDNETPIYQISTVNDSNSGYYPYIKFKGLWNDGSRESRGLPICPGCYFDWRGNRWLGSLTGSGRSDNEAVTPDDPELDAQETTVTTTEPTQYGFYAYGRLKTTDNEYAKFSSNDVGGEIILNLTQGGTYNMMLRVGPSSGWTEYGVQANKQVQLSSDTVSGHAQDYNFINSNDQKQKLTLTVNTTGKYRIKIIKKDSGSINLRFSYISG